MKQSDKTLSQFGEILNEAAKHLNITQRAICAEVGLSRTTYSDVWFGRPVSITHYLRVFRYLYEESGERQRRQLDAALLHLFHGD